MLYFFSVTDGSSSSIAMDCGSDAEARRHALRYVGDMLRLEPGRLECGELNVQVKDSEENSLFTVRVTTRIGD